MVLPMLMTFLTPSWISPTIFLAGISFAEMMPGPVFNISCALPCTQIARVNKSMRLIDVARSSRFPRHSTGSEQRSLLAVGHPPVLGRHDGAAGSHVISLGLERAGEDLRCGCRPHGTRSYLDLWCLHTLGRDSARKIAMPKDAESMPTPPKIVNLFRDLHESRGTPQAAPVPARSARQALTRRFQHSIVNKTKTIQ